jgi:allantoin racemase
MRLLLLNANATEAVTEKIAAEARRVALSGTEILPVTGRFGGRIVGTRAEIAIAEHAALDLAARHGGEADAVLIGVSFDVGLRALRELLSVPVVGMTEAACLTACMLGGRFGLVTYGRRNAATFREIVTGYGLADRLAGIRAPDLTPAEMLTDPEGTAAAIAEAARDLADTDGAEVVVLAGATMAGLPSLIQPLVPVPLVEGIASGVGLAEMLARLHPAGAFGGSYARVGGRQSTGLSAELSRMLSGA